MYFINGATTDINPNNNVASVVVNRLTTGEVHSVQFVEVRSSSKLYENPIRYNSIDEAILEKGLNFIYIHYDDGTVEIRKISVN
jgi:predicted Holliday junction resolvase-like endonuclease